MVSVPKQIKGMPGVALIVVLGGCAANSQIAVKDVAADKMAYLNQQFAAESIKPEVSKQILNGDASTVGFQKMNVVYDAVLEAGEGKKETPRVSVTYQNAGNGLIQELKESSTNDIPYSLFYSLNDKGFLYLKSQTVRLGNTYPGPAYEIKEVTRYDRIPANPKEDAEYVFEYKSGLHNQGMNFTPLQLKCKSGKYYPASKIHTKLHGNAIDLSCDSYSNNILFGETKRAYLPQYGVALQMGYQNVTSKDSYKVVDVTIQ